MKLFLTQVKKNFFFEIKKKKNNRLININYQN